MKEILSFLAIIVLSFQSNAQLPPFGFCEINQEWNKFRLVHEALPDSLSKILIITNRPFNPDNCDGIYFQNAIAGFRKVTYIEVACTGNEWLMHELSDFGEGMKSVDTGNDILLFIHGHGKSFPTAVTSASQLSKRYGITVVLYDWPAQNSNFNKSLARVRRCSDNFYNLLLGLKTYRQNVMDKTQHLSVLAHSLGNYYLSYLSVNGNWQYLNDPFIDNILFNAPAIRTKEHGQVLSLLRLSKRKYVALNKNDRVLRGAQLLTSGKMLGNQIIEPRAEHTLYADFTNISEKEHNWMLGYHEFEYKTPGIFYFYNTVIHGGEVDFSKPFFTVAGENEYLISR
ncbi:MAG: alpha/beta hydrolase [Bacteroidota bacterium]